MVNRSRGWFYTIWPEKRENIAEDILEHCSKDANLIYAVCAREICPETEREHYHMIAYWKNPITGKGCQTRMGLNGGEFNAQSQKGTHQQAIDYVKKDEVLVFAYGEIPLDGQSPKTSAWDYILEMIQEGATDFEIMMKYPSYYAKCKTGITAMRTELAFQTVGEFREINVTYIWGPTGSGKTRGVLESAEHPRDVYKVVDYKHPFDNYRGQDIILFDEFRSSIKLEQMLNYIDGYIVELPCRYHNKVSQWSQVYIVSNIPMSEQYPSFQEYDISIGKKQSWDAWLRRIDAQVHKGLLEGNIRPLDNEDALGDESSGESSRDPFQDRVYRSLAGQQMMSSKLDSRVKEWEEQLGLPLVEHIKWQKESDKSESIS